MIEFSEKSNTLMAALLAVQGKVSGVARDATNPHFKNRYATLENVVNAIRPHCIENGLVVMQAAGEPVDGFMPVQTRITHAESGEWLSSTIALPTTKPDAQGFGSVITYASRYSLMSLFCIPPADDDGEGASGKPTKATHTTGGMTERHPNTVSDGRQKSAGQAKKDGDSVLFNMIDECESEASLQALYKAQRGAVEALPGNWQNLWLQKFDEKRATITEKV
jgi:hypothetical protein